MDAETEIRITLHAGRWAPGTVIPGTFVKKFKGFIPPYERMKIGMYSVMLVDSRVEIEREDELLPKATLRYAAKDWGKDAIRYAFKLLIDDGWKNENIDVQGS